MIKRIFLDYASATPVAPEVLDAMRPWVEQDFANPSALYSEALKAKDAVSLARLSIANELHAERNEIYYTSGGTESNNLALLGVFEHARIEYAEEKRKGVPHVVTTAIEHSSILETCEEIIRRGGEVTIVPVGDDGVVRVEDIKNALQENTVLVSVGYVNNEIGTIQPLHDIAKMLRQWRQSHAGWPYFHTDACQAPLYLTLDTLTLGVDLMTLDGLKMHGPRGVGVLFVRTGIPLHPILFGGGQEGGLRSGTENVPGIIGFTRALEMAKEMRDSESVRLSHIRDKTIEKIVAQFPTASVNGSPTERIANNINICFPGLDAEFAVISLDVQGIAISYSSTCRMLSENSSSYVISALGKGSPTNDCSTSSLRITMGRETTEGEMDALVQMLEKVLK